MATVCEPCLERTHRAVPATHFVNRTAMCDACFGDEPESQAPGRVPLVLNNKSLAEIANEEFGEAKPKQDGSIMSKLCKCGCGKQASAGRDYAWGHKTKNGVMPTPAPKALSTNGGKFAAVIAELTAERDKLNAAIETLERLS